MLEINSDLFRFNLIFLSENNLISAIVVLLIDIFQETPVLHNHKWYAVMKGIVNVVITRVRVHNYIIKHPIITENRLTLNSRFNQ